MTESSVATESAPSGKDCADETTAVTSGISIEDLPDELLLAITKKLDLSSQCKLNLVNSRFREIARDRIYDSVSIRGPRSEQYMDIPRFFRAVNSQPQLARRVRRLWIRLVYRDAIFDAGECLGVSLQTRSTFTKALSETGLSEPALTGALLTLLPGLEVLGISAWENQTRDDDEMVDVYFYASDPLYALLV
jgi:hypothetical protein